MEFNETFWVGLSFVIFVVLVAKPAVKFINNALDNRSTKIEKELSEVRRLKEEAQAMLAVYQRHKNRTEEEAEEIISHARDESKRMMDDAKQSLEIEIQKKTELALAKITQAEALVAQQVRDNAIDITVSAAKALILENLGKEASDEIITTAINTMGRRFN